MFLEHYKNSDATTGGGILRSGRSSYGNTDVLHGITTLGLPWILDKWHDLNTRSRISIQIQLPSGNDVHRRTTVRVATDQKSLVLTFPMSNYLSSVKQAFNPYIFGMGDFNEERTEFLEYVLKLHPKVIARKRSLEIISERNVMKEIMYEQRVPLGRKVHHSFADQDDDDLFYGKKFVFYPDGSCHLHVELICDSGDGYDIVEGNDEPNVVDVMMGDYNTPDRFSRDKPEDVGTHGSEYASTKSMETDTVAKTVKSRHKKKKGDTLHNKTYLIQT